MFKLIKNGDTASDGWKTMILGKSETAENARLPIGPLLVPLAVWKARRTELIHREYEHGWPLGIWLSTEESAEEIANDIEDFTVIAVQFDRFSDGKSYATAHALREQYGYSGELRAIGDVPNERSDYHYQAGFHSSAVKISPSAANLALV